MSSTPSLFLRWITFRFLNSALNFAAVMKLVRFFNGTGLAPEFWNRFCLIVLFRFYQAVTARCFTAIDTFYFILDVPNRSQLIRIKDESVYPEKDQSTDQISNDSSDPIFFCAEDTRRVFEVRYYRRQNRSTELPPEQVE